MAAQLIPSDPVVSPRRSWLWLWVVLGAGAWGLALGGTAALVVGPERPAARSDDQPPESSAGPELAPMPRPAKSSGATGTITSGGNLPVAGLKPVPAATEFPGLTFYLACDAIDGGGVIEGVSGQRVGTLGAAELTDGVRGKALRLTSPKHNAHPRYALDLTDQLDRIAVPAGKPFTLAMWVRLPEAPRTDVTVFTGFQVLSQRLRSFYVYARSVSGRIHVSEPDGPPEPGKWKWVQVHESMVRDKQADPKGWFHLAITRDAAGTTHTLLDGKPYPARSQFPFEMRYTSIGFLHGSPNPGVVDVDEFCLFDRSLSADEVMRLAAGGGGAGLSADPANRPKVPKVEKVEPGRGALSPAELPGLRFHLACDAIDDGKVIEAVSGKPVGKLFGAALTEGVRGKALRLTHDRKEPNRYALDLSDQKEALAVAADKPFTLAFWARRVRSDQTSGYGAFLTSAESEFPKNPARSLTLQMLPNANPIAVASLLNMTNRGDQATARRMDANRRIDDPAAWNHFALVRTGAGELTWLVNGDRAGGGEFPFELRYHTFGLIRSPGGMSEFDLDEFCLYDRALTEAEIKKLATSAK
jgi:hypothetical protein